MGDRDREQAGQVADPVVAQLVGFVVDGAHPVAGVVVAQARLVEAAVHRDGGDDVDHGVAAVQEQARAVGLDAGAVRVGNRPSLAPDGERDHDFGPDVVAQGVDVVEAALVGGSGLEDGFPAACRRGGQAQVRVVLGVWGGSAEERVRGGARVQVGGEGGGAQARVGGYGVFGVPGRVHAGVLHAGLFLVGGFLGCGTRVERPAVASRLPARSAGGVRQGMAHVPSAGSGAQVDGWRLPAARVEYAWYGVAGPCWTLCCKDLHGWHGLCLMLRFLPQTAEANKRKTGTRAGEKNA